MRKLHLYACVGASLFALAACNKPPVDTATNRAATAPVEAPAKVLSANATDAEKIASAMSAAPKAIAADAGVMDMTPAGMRELRKGTNNFVCTPDLPTTPGPDPMCADANAMAWLDAYVAKKPPPKGKVGFVYMLAGGTDASNTDPYATGPSSGNNWIETGPHVMVVGAAEQMAGYPRDPKPDTAKPYVMWAGTPYEHLMIPVK